MERLTKDFTHPITTHLITYHITRRFAYLDHTNCFNHFSSTSHTHSTFSSLTAASIATSTTLDPRDVVSSLSSRTANLCSYRNDGGINATAEELYADGFRQASRQFKKPPAATALLRNVPISVKDCIGVRGCLQTGGLAVRTLEEHRSEVDSTLVATLRSQGAIPIVRGNVSQCMMLPESANNVWGETLNPWDKTRTPGGSSGGEGALVATGCVPLAVGSDVGGSIRIPASFCGIAGFKPSPGRISKKGCMAPRKDNRHGPGIVIPSTPGPLARTVDDCALFCEAVWTEEHFKKDKNVVAKVFDKKTYKKEDKVRMKQQQQE